MKFEMFINEQLTDAQMERVNERVPQLGALILKTLKDNDFKPTSSIERIALNCAFLELIIHVLICSDAIPPWKRHEAVGMLAAAQGDITQHYLNVEAESN